jgi:hypothetical protein
MRAFARRPFWLRPHLAGPAGFGLVLTLAQEKARQIDRDDIYAEI